MYDELLQALVSLYLVVQVVSYWTVHTSGPWPLQVLSRGRLHTRTLSLLT